MMMATVPGEIIRKILRLMYIITEDIMVVMLDTTIIRIGMVTGFVLTGALDILGDGVTHTMDTMVGDILTIITEGITVIITTHTMDMAVMAAILPTIAEEETWIILEEDRLIEVNRMYLTEEVRIPDLS